MNSRHAVGREQVASGPHARLRHLARMTLTDFLRSRIADDEMHANWWCEDHATCHQPDHPGHHCPARVRAECEAKRVAIETMDVDGWQFFRAMAAVYADHPDYDESWRP